MVNTSLDRSYRASDKMVMDFSPVPDGEYKLRVKEVTPWTAKTQTVKVYVKDENGRPMVNEKGERVTETVPNCTFYNAMVKFEIVGGAYDGRLIFHNITNHPNMDWSIPNFLDGIGVSECSASQIPSVCKGKVTIGNITTRSYDKKVQDKDTGIDKIEKKFVNEIKSFIALDEPSMENNEMTDLGI